ncbi:hypothetical protein [Rhizobium sp. RU36D]|uniref:hypothetical protein n=1 Tax=Rhizobium sp. RU36D TaxID=1907415 RepID=UPI0009D8CE1D|nr:hypothetical protein [Rhizobium sp. RU36D]SMC96506.1 hypothetical protein SAMN05880593_11267 [Rhizobium sp. RU36D]
MLRLAAVLYILVAAAAAGAAVTAVLSLRLLEGWQIAGAFLAGCVVALPIAYVLARKIYAAIAPRSV